MRVIVVSCLVFVHPLLMTFWKVQPSLPKYLEFVTVSVCSYAFFCDYCKIYNLI